ncbi:putative RNA-directed DNA polymerase, eukaryota, reverse transcriptase zinc-binding domain protein [Tanacetum coccineum]|uniref:RNA-directed DNA polymerase, eukaryota, reverse transcriptase zinc-binding domain protein n=1 Tax=Tanacetum coccineum TaxID=301880 RepID=A0ABQ4XCQ0_9ASTR
MDFIKETLKIPFNNETLSIRVIEVEGEIDNLFNGYVFASSSEYNSSDSDDGDNNLNQGDASHFGEDSDHQVRVSKSFPFEDKNHNDSKHVVAENTHSGVGSKSSTCEEVNDKNTTSLFTEIVSDTLDELLASKEGDGFVAIKGLQQGDPLSPPLFILVVGALNVALLEAKNNHSFRGIEVGKDKVHVSHFQFADDALIMGEWSKINVLNLSRLITCFHLASGLKVNFNKSKLFGIGVCEVERNSLASLIGCQSSNFPCNYLGLPIGANMSRCDNWLPLLERFHKRLSSWKAKQFHLVVALLSLNLSLGGGLDSNKIVWIAWDKVISPLKDGGLDIGSLRVSNMSLLAKWWRRFLCETSSIWASVIKSIHGQHGGLQDISTIRNKSGAWYQIAKLNQDLTSYRIDLHTLFRLKIGNGELISFWKDVWVGNSPLCNAFPRLFRLELHHLCRVCDRVIGAESNEYHINKY